MSSTAVCISVIDEASPSISTQRDDWTAFRNNWPNRPFWLLDPGGPSTDPAAQLDVPSNFASDPLATGPITVNRDRGIVASRSDWFAICQLNTLPRGSVISLAIDTSGSMTLNTVSASYVYFLQRCVENDIFIIADTTFPNELWIRPHNKSLPPNAFITADPKILIAGGTTTVSWTVSGEYDSINLDGFGTVGPTGSISLTLNQTRQFILTATGPGGTSTRAVTVFVYVPAVVSIIADNNIITKGQCTTLRWFTSGDATGASISPGIGAVNINGIRSVCPTVTTTYKIDVTDYAVGDSDSVTVEVVLSDPTNLPNPIPIFEPLSNLPLSSEVYSNVVVVQGLLSPAIVSAGFNTKIAVSNNNITTTNENGYQVLSNATFSDTVTVTNGQYIQLRSVSSNNANTGIDIDVNIGDGASITSWTISTGVALSIRPNNFTFENVINVAPNTLIESEPAPVGGITGLGTEVTVDVVLVSTTGTEPKIKINNGSIGVFPARVKNGDVITLYNKSSASLAGNVETQIKVGTRFIVPWSIDTYSAPDSTPFFAAPPNLTNRPPNTYVNSAIIGIGDFNVPSVTITATNGALISIDYDTPVAGPRTFTANNQLIILTLQTPNALSSSVSTVVTIGDAQPFTWSVGTYAIAPPAPSNLSTWYSIKTKKYDGYSIGTVVQVLKENVVTEYGDLQDRFPGFLECDGSSYPVAQYPDLWNIIKNTYGGDGNYNSTTKEYSGLFNVPDYRNRRICGVGVVDGNRGGSSFLPTFSGSINQVGSSGGYWYIDRTGVAGPLPLEQVFDGGTESNFFTIGTVKTFGTENLIGEVNFAVNGSVNAFIQEVGETFVNVPPHEHIYFSSTTESDSGEPLIPWDKRALYANDSAVSNASRGRVRSGEERDENIEQFREAAGSLFITEVTATGLEFDSIVPFDTTETIDFGNWWASPVNVLTSLAGNRIYDIGGPAANDAGVVDTRLASMRLNPYASPGELRTHSHLMSLDVPTNPQTDFTYGNVNGAGSKYGDPNNPNQVSLPNANTILEVIFDQSDVLLELSPATFTFSGSVKPIPTVELSPNKVVPLATPFHKVKYIIKAY